MCMTIKFNSCPHERNLSLTVGMKLFWLVSKLRRNHKDTLKC